MPKPKRVIYELIPRDNTVYRSMYVLLARLIEQYHEDLIPARIALAWCTGWKPDPDGRCILGQCRRANDLDKELAAYDFVILLKKSFWIDLRVTDVQREALLDHELCHGARAFDKEGEPMVDERGRAVWRTVKHDLEEFSCIAERYGTWKSDIEIFAAALRRSGAPAYQPCEQCRESPGWIAVTDDAGVSRVARCACWLAWTERREAMSA